MKFSTGNQIKGKIMEIRKGAVTAIVYVAIPGDTMLEASVTIASLETLGLYEGKSVILMVNPGLGRATGINLAVVLLSLIAVLLIRRACYRIDPQQFGIRRPELIRVTARRAA